MSNPDQVVYARKLSGEKIFISQEVQDKLGVVMKLQNINLEGYNFSQFIQLKQGEFCYVCSNPVTDKLNCNKCRNVICQSCSKKTINEKKVCDMCFVKAYLHNAGQRNKAIIDNKKKTIKDFKNQQHQLKSQIQEIESQIGAIQSTLITEEQYKDRLKQQQQILDDIKIQMAQKEKLYEEKKQSLSEMQKQITKFYFTLNTLSTKTNGKKQEINNEKDKTTNKIQILENLEYQRQKLLNSASFQNYKMQTKQEQLLLDQQQAQLLVNEKLNADASQNTVPIQAAHQDFAPGNSENQNQSNLNGAEPGSQALAEDASNKLDQPKDVNWQAEHHYGQLPKDIGNEGNIQNSEEDQREKDKNVVQSEICKCQTF